MTDASSFFPGQLFQNPDGSFSLDVTGHLHAQGIDLDAGTNGTPPSQDRIRWIRTADGFVAVEDYGWSVSPGSTRIIQAHSNAGSLARIALASSDTTAPKSSIDVTADSKIASVIDSDGTSHFVKVMGVNGLTDSYFPTHITAISRPSKAHVSAGPAIFGAGWQNYLIDTVDFDPDNLFPNVGGIECTAPAAGYYHMILQAALTNGTGASASAAIGWNLGAGLMEQTWVDNTQKIRFNASVIMLLAAGDTIQPAIWVSASGGFNWSIEAGSIIQTMQRVG